MHLLILKEFISRDRFLVKMVLKYRDCLKRVYIYIHKWSLFV